MEPHFRFAASVATLFVASGSAHPLISCSTMTSNPDKVTYECSLAAGKVVAHHTNNDVNRTTNLVSD